MRLYKICAAAALLFAATSASAQINGESRLTVGGYGEAAFTRNFYSDSPYKYAKPSEHKNDADHGRFDIPHAVIYIGYDFGKGWTMQSEIEFEHTGTGAAIEREYEEAGEFEQEIEKGGEVELEQFWIQKSFCPQLNVRAGHIIVPVDGLNNAHEPLNFFTVYRPEGEYTIFPSTWHDTGISVWGQAGDWRYEALMVAGLDGFMFNTDNFIKNGAGSPYEFKVANTYGFAGRIDNTSIRNLRLSLSGWYGNSMHNTYPNDLKGDGLRYNDTKGRVLIGSFDFLYKTKRFIARGNADYATVGDCTDISRAKAVRAANDSPYSKEPVGKAAYSCGLEAGYDILPFFNLKDKDQQLFVFGRAEAYNSYIPASTQQSASYTERMRIAAGVNWYPVPQIAVKAEYSQRILKSEYNNEPSISLGVAYMGFFRH